ncbi:hypothetical protein FA09DRAFT_4003 [Tilletiopsis washingtonensis]|uniref:RRM domain-containing protein n=1 Tax=Tilletiopsis washingtonensis TaxID=58919 RepID=A0A316ZI41_9BASI|nr:hypothetical protein FA09DRAFT_4003 [Tilletiopsis washingtonensis]PWO01170.1 hypothetical protein FA09DRAFT_4003 [Tilletiopsis washingtonensis]
MSPTSAFSVPRRIVFITNVNLDWTEDQLRGSVYQHTSVHVNRMQRVMEGYFLDCDSSADAGTVAKGMTGRQMLRQGSPVSAVTLDADDRRAKALAYRFLPAPKTSQRGESSDRHSSYWDRRPEKERVPDAAPALAPRAHSSSYWDLTPSEPKDVAARRREERHRRGSQAPSSDLAQPYGDFALRPDAGALYRAHLPERWQAGLAAVPLTAAELARTAPPAHSPTRRPTPAAAPRSDSLFGHPQTHIRACHHLYAGGLAPECTWQDLKDFARIHCDKVGYATVLPGHHGAVRG